jgi:hypothetical protein
VLLRYCCDKMLRHIFSSSYYSSTSNRNLGWNRNKGGRTPPNCAFREHGLCAWGCIRSRTQNNSDELTTIVMDYPEQRRVVTTLDRPYPRWTWTRRVADCATGLSLVLIWTSPSSVRIIEAGTRYSCSGGETGTCAQGADGPKVTPASN